MSIFFAILLFSFLVFVHELGHFTAAKLSGVQVNEFSVFMGPAIWKKQKGETLYALRLIPFGGYCAMEGEDEESDNPRAFGRATWWKKLIILVAGAAMNFIVGVALMVIVYLPINRVVVPVVTAVQDYCTMDGLQLGDEIVELDGEKIYVYTDFSVIFNLNGEGLHDLVVKRDGETVELKDVPMYTTEVEQEDGSTRSLLGLSFTVEDLSFTGKLRYAWRQSIDTVRLVRMSLQMLVSGQAGLKDMTGPVGIVQQMSSVAESSETWVDALLSLLYFGGFIAINLAVMNLLPLPALDGGRAVGVLITALVEGITHRKVNPKYEGYLHGAGMVVLLGLMAVVMFKDIWTLFR